MVRSNLVSAYTNEDLPGLLTGEPPELPGERPDPGVSEVKLALASVQAHMDDVSKMVSGVSEALDALEQGRPAPATTIGDVARRTVPRWHFPMLNDHERNDAFAVALERQITPGAHVLDIGSGTGLLAMMAVQAGAAKVTTCEANPLLAEVARQVVAAHGMSDEITVLPKMSTDLVLGRDLERPADLIVSEIVDCGLIGEGMLPTFEHARTNLLAEDGRMLPGSGRLYGFLVDSPVAVGLNRVATAGGYDVRLFNQLATRGHFPIRLNTWPHHVLSDTVEVVGFDLHHDDLGDSERTVRVPVTRDGTAHAMVLWFELNLGAGVAVRNSPENVGSHWMQALTLFDRPVEVSEGGELRVTVTWQDEQLRAHAESATDWKGTR